MTPGWYSVFMILAVLLSAAWWYRLSRRRHDLFMVYIGGLIGAFLGAKIAFVLAEGTLALASPDPAQAFLTGKSVLGALLGGFTGVELFKKWFGITAITGDWFASFVPLAIGLGRVGCILQGCCPGRWVEIHELGRFRWPASHVEIGFNIAAAAMFFLWRQKKILPGQHFHLYLVAYGCFRFFHEWLRETPKWFGWSGYQGLAILVALVGILAYRRRARKIKLTAQEVDQVLGVSRGPR